MKSETSVLVGDDHPVVRAAVKMVLKEEGFKRIFEAPSGKEVLSKVREHLPDLVVLDLGFPDGDGLDVLARIQASHVPCQVLVFTAQDPRVYQGRCMRAGAAAYVAKTNDLQHLHKAIRAVMAGYTYFAQLPCPSVALNTSQLSEKQKIDTLSDRELAILQQLAQGMSNKVIAEIMHLSHKTVSTYKTRLIEKLNVETAVHLREFAKRNQLIK